MPDYIYRQSSFDEEDSVEIPTGAIGVTITTFGDPMNSRINVRYLEPLDPNETQTEDSSS